MPSPPPPSLRPSTAQRASNPTALEQAILRAFAVDHKRATRLCQDIEWALGLMPVPSKMPKVDLRKVTKRKRSARANSDPVYRVL